MTRPIRDLDVPATVVAAGTALRALLAHPPAGHTPNPQPADWYERVFDAMACAHPETCGCTPEETNR
ncbi:hypothetical protein ACF1BS_03710 [Streptomyces sp. NPDC014748]|uniref:hypothetical protein n=1 Tax=Streptomyces sp. NPDC014748 TaxID=3364905 RepID=UPI0036FBB421